ncbi:MAG: hypothetical protein M3280_13480 [Actinomycetota bacterium]|nr:hypothetical protein [Actinomycetota bacterium]
MKRYLSAVFVFVLLGAAMLPSAGARSEGAPAQSDIRFGPATGGTPGPITGAAAEAIRSGPLPADRGEYDRAKERAAARFHPESTESGGGSPPPTLGKSKQGLFDATRTPSDSTGAIGTQRYVETVNSQVGIYDRSLNLINQDTLVNWWAQPGSNSFDPQVIWDPTTNRFYYAGDSVFSSTDNRLSFGFSKTAAPNNATSDWCHYQVAYGASFPDYPKLGDSKFFVIIGVNVFTGGTFSGSDILAIGKAPPGTTCPDASTFEFGIEQDIMVGADVQFTPVPANEIDTNKNGWVLSRPAALPADDLGRFKVSRNSTTGNPIIQNPGTPIAVASYTLPPNAPQKDGTFNLDTSDARLTQAVAAVDPSRDRKLHVWTQHAIAGGAGSRERWYEVNPAAATVARSGTVQHDSLYVFNGAISPDRVVNGTTRAFGRNMVLGFSTSSATTYPAIRMVGRRGNDPTSGFVLVKNSPGHNEDFGCPVNGFCRWGDYSAATPDPKADVSKATGRIYLSNMWTADADTTGGTSGASWRTWNWAARP